MPTYLTVRRVRGPAWNATLPMRSQPQSSVIARVEPWEVLLDGRAEQQPSR